MNKNVPLREGQAYSSPVRLIFVAIGRQENGWAPISSIPILLSMQNHIIFVFWAWLSFGTVYPRLQKLSISSLKQSSHWKMEKCWSQACLTVLKSCVLIWDRFGGLQRASIPRHILPLRREGRVCLTGKLLSSPALPRPQGAWSLVNPPQVLTPLISSWLHNSPPGCTLYQCRSKPWSAELTFQPSDWM